MEAPATKDEREKRYWIKPSVKVFHASAPSRCMTVMRIDQRRRTNKNTGESTVRMIGVFCRWIADDGTLQTERFHSKELQPWASGA